MLLVVCLLVFIEICRDVVGKGWRGGGAQESWLDVRRPSPSPQQHQHRATDSNQQVHNNVMWSVVYKHLALFINKRVVHKHRGYFCGIWCIYAYACLPM